MPTGYTAAVADGGITEFRDFALDCARAFGACVTLRDEPHDAPIPDEFQPSTDYHDKAIRQAKHELELVLAMSDEECEEAARVEYVAAVETHRERGQELEDRRLRYKRMLEKAEAWKSPSDDHDGLKDFMVSQLRKSIDFDCTHHGKFPERETGAEWRSRKLAKANRDIEYHEDERQKEIDRVSSRNNWLKQLRQSLR
jgi:hypothetical protein